MKDARIIAGIQYPFRQGGTAAAVAPGKNIGLTPDLVSYGSQRKIWWHCEHGHEWKAVIYSRTGAQKCGCPVCSGKTAKRI